MRRFFLNNVIVNNIAIFFGLEKYIKNANNYWKSYAVQPNKTPQEAAGYSNVAEMQVVVENLHNGLKEIKDTYLKKGDTVLDIGCGPGLFLKDFDTTYNLSGIDLSPDFLKFAKENNPTATIYQGDFLEQTFPQKFSLIYAIGVLQYFSGNDLTRFFEKAHHLLENDGILFISYPHAVSAKDLSFPDINYISYSPDLLNEKTSKCGLHLISNKHLIDNRVVTDFDRTPYKPSIPGVDKIYKNSSILIAQKRA